MDEKARWRKVSSSVLLKIRQIARLLAELEADIVRGDWTVIGTYPQVLLAYTDIFTKYTDTAFSGDISYMTIAEVLICRPRKNQRHITNKMQQHYFLAEN